MKYLASVLLLALSTAGPVSASVTPPELHTTIRVMVLRDSSVSQNIVNQRIDFLEDSWSNTPGIGSVTLTIVNPSAAILFPLPQGGAQTQIDIAKLLVNAPVLPGQPSLREIWAADIAILVTDEATVQDPSGNTIPTCGLADGGVKGIWAGPTASFQPNGEGVDLRGSEVAWFGLLAAHPTPVNCASLLQGAAHELGHLMGGGHWATPDPGTEPLNADARAWRAHVNLPALQMNHTYRSALTGPNACVSGSVCFESKLYSNVTTFGNTSHQNVQTLNQTALSVANYFRGDPAPTNTVAQCADGQDNDGDALVDTADPDCTGPTDDDEAGPPPNPMPPGCNPTSFRPTNVSASLTAICDPTLTFSIYRLRWDDACPGDSYLIEANEGSGTYIVGTVFGLSTPLTVDGGSGTVTVRSCSGFSCSAASSPPVFVFDGC